MRLVYNRYVYFIMGKKIKKKKFLFFFDMQIIQFQFKQPFKFSLRYFLVEVCLSDDLYLL